MRSCSALRALINGCSCGRTPDEHFRFGSLAINDQGRQGENRGQRTVARPQHPPLRRPPGPSEFGAVEPDTTLGPGLGRRLPGISRKSPRNLQKKISQATSLSSRSLLANPPRAAATPGWPWLRQHSPKPVRFRWKSAIRAGPVRAHVISDIRGPRAQDLGSQ